MSDERIDIGDMSFPAITNDGITPGDVWIGGPDAKFNPQQPGFSVTDGGLYEAGYQPVGRIKDDTDTPPTTQM